MYGISSFARSAKITAFYMAKSHVFVFLAENGVFNTNESPRVADGIRNEHAIHLRFVSKNVANLISYRGVRRITA